MAGRSERRDSNSQLLHELDALSHNLYGPSQTGRRTASLVIPRSAAPAPDPIPVIAPADISVSTHRPRSRRMSMSPFRSRTKSHQETDVPDANSHSQTSALAGVPTGDSEKKGIWGWKPLRALSHIRMHRIDCLFSVEVVEAEGLPPSMNGLRLAVAVRKKENKDGSVQTMPSRVVQESANFEETLFIRCHIYCSGGSGTGKPLKFEPRPFLISAVAIDAPELDFGRSMVDLTLLVKESMEKSVEGARVRQWDAAFPLSGKAKGGRLVLKLGFQIMEDGGVGIYNQAETNIQSRNNNANRMQSKSSFSVSSPRVTRAEPPSTPNLKEMPMDLKGIDDFNLDEPEAPSVKDDEGKHGDDDDQDLLDFDVVDKGVEINQEEEDAATTAVAAAAVAAEPEEAVGDEAASVSSEVVKEVVLHDEKVAQHDSAHLLRLTELDAIAKQIKALETIMVGDGESAKPTEQRLEAEEETVTREFLQLLELDQEEHGKPSEYNLAQEDDLVSPQESGETKCFISDLGKGLGSVVQTRDGGYLAAMNPLDVEVERKATPKLAMQISRPLLIFEDQSSGFEVFQKLAAMGPDELSSKLFSLAAMDELMGKTAEQVAFEGMAAAIISGRSSKEAASSSAERSVAALKTMSAAMAEGRRERITSGIWNVREEPVVVEEILAFSLQRIETMAVEALKVQAGVAEEEAPFDASPLAGAINPKPLDSVISNDDWERSCAGAQAVTLLLLVQLRDPLRRYETVGAPVIAVVQAARVDGGRGEEGRFKLTNLHVGGLRVRPGGGRSTWDGEKQRLTAMQWLVAYGLAKASSRRKSRAVVAKGGQGLLWSLSSRVMADMWLKPMRNPDVKISE